MDKIQNKLFSFVKSWHANQKRKYTNEPYWTHVLNVGLVAQDYNVTWGFEIGVCHDLLEDTECTEKDLIKFFIDEEYHKGETIVENVIALTDKYTKENYPNLNRFERKRLEAFRLSKASNLAQSVKYCDLIDNTHSITKHDPKFAKTYIQEKEFLLSVMNKGNSELYIECKQVLEQAKKELKKWI